MADLMARAAFVGRYRLVREIGAGGMASVYLARVDGPGGFQKWVAVKRVHPHLVEDESFVTMFFDEARVAARISHPNVATVFDVGKDAGTYWIAMEYLHGEPLREVMRRIEEERRPMPPEIACRILSDAAEGLHAAHELVGPAGERLELVHRDVTPHNLFVTYEGVTKVVDFGVAKFRSRLARTRAGMLKGKVGYMSPEQVAGAAVDRRSDVFALGVVMWELTTGHRLLPGGERDAKARLDAWNPPRPGALVRGYPVGLETIVTTALAKSPADRFRTAREFSRALQSLLVRRGSFVGTDEVGAYMGEIFADRIRRRQAQLRRAETTPDGSERDFGGPTGESPVAREDDAADTVVGPPPSMSDFPEPASAPELDGSTDTPPPSAFPSRKDAMAPQLPEPRPPSRQAMRRGRVPGASLPTWAMILSATLLGVVAFVLVLLTLSRLSPEPSRSNGSRRTGLCVPCWPRCLGRSASTRPSRRSLPAETGWLT